MADSGNGGVAPKGLDADYERTQDLVNNHFIICQMLGHGDFVDDHHWGVQTLKDHLRLFTREILERINAVVKDGHALEKKAPVTASPCAVTPSSSRPTSITPPTPSCCMTPCLR